ncbi:MAG TPA: MFS transporter [Tepidisphaeraceae bacterium]|nr:MFS transporter [Tepidisphaeraceae bacterium]
MTTGNGNQNASPAAANSRDGGLRHVFRALRHRNYKLFFAGQLVSLIGTFLTFNATNWLVLRLTNSPAALGLVGFAGQIPSFILAPFAGVWVDRLNRRRLIVCTQTLAMVQSFALAALALPHIINMPEIIGLSLFQGLINAFDMPARQAFLVEMVTDREDLPNAIALNSTMVHTARILGPAMAGLLIGFFGEGLCFTIDGASYIAVIVALLAMTVIPRPSRWEGSVLKDFKEGIKYVWGHVPIRALLIVMSLLSLTGLPAMAVLLPIFGKQFGHSARWGPMAYGLLGACTGVGALAGAIYLASRRSVVGLGRIMTIAMFCLSFGLIAFGFSPYLIVSALIAPIIGWGMLTLLASTNTLLQTLTDDDKRGRVMSFFSVAFVGMTPWGSLLVGWIAQRLSPRRAAIDVAVVGASRTLCLEGGLCVIAAIAFAMLLPGLRKLIRPIYQRKGILPVVAEGLQAASQSAEVGEE